MILPHERFPRPHLVLILVLGFVVFILPLVFWFRVDYFQICPQCAQQRDAQVWLIPFTRWDYCTFAEITDSALTIRLREFGYLDEHPHVWLVVRGSGPGYCDTLGEGSPIAPGLLPPEIAHFIALLHLHTDSETVAFWFARMTHPQHSDFVRKVAEACVREPFADADDFRACLQSVTGREHRLLIGRWGRVDEPETRTPPRLLYQRPPR